MTSEDGWEHLRDIEGSRSEHLLGKTVVLALSGSVAALESHRLARALMRHGAQVRCVVTAAATELVSTTSLEWATGFSVVTRLTGRCEHLEFFGERGRADLLLLAPATANTIGKLALGLDDNAVTTTAITALGSSAPFLCCPGMHEPMMANPAVQRNLARLAELGVEILEPTVLEGKAKMMGVEEIVARVLRRLGPWDLKGRRVLLTGGPTREYLDPARCLTNPSSGQSACLLAREAYRRGAEVVLVYGPGQAQPDPWLRVRRVETGEQMGEAVQAVLAQESIDIALAVAAVADFKPSQRQEQKMATVQSAELELRLVATPKIIDRIRSLSPETRLVGFKASSHRRDEELEMEARRYLESGRVDTMVANSISEPGLGFESPHNRYLVIGRTGKPQAIGPAGKEILATKLWDVLLA